MNHMQRRHSLRIIEIITELLHSFGYFIGKLWHVEDIHSLCEREGWAKISDAEAMEVFVLTQERCHAATSGISRAQLEKTLRMYVESRMSAYAPADEADMADETEMLA